MLLKEMEEINNWARLGVQLYFGWFALQFTVNGVAAGWVFTYKGAMPSFARLIFAIFMGWNLMGTITTFRFHKHILGCDQRIRDVIAALSARHTTEDASIPPRSPVPREAISTVFRLCAATMLMSLLFWTILEVCPRILSTPHSTLD
jgi:hypothetical protein